MAVKVVILHSAEMDLHSLKRYLTQNFGQAVWRQSYALIKEAIARVAAYPKLGVTPDELANLHLVQYRQVVTGMNRIIYELRGDTAFVHIVCDTRKDLQTLLMSRILVP